MTVKLQGTIVSPDYDDEYFAAWIDRGIITPSSRLVAAVDGATEPFDLYVNSYGGDVFAGGEMQIALVKAAAANKIRTCEVGSIAASMAANIIAALRAVGVPVTAHANSQLMFHGCYTETVGGAQHHEDVAASLRNINDTVMANLKRCGVDECRAWFAEGREKWIGADEAISLNLFSTVAETDAAAPAEAKHTAARLAAFASTIQSRTEYQMKLDESIKAEEPVEAAPAAPAAEPAPEAAPAVEETKTETPAEPAPESPAAEASAVTDEAFEQRVAEAANARFAALQSAHDKMISELKDKLAKAEAALATANAERDQAVEASVKAKEALDEAVNQAKIAERNRESVVVAALKPEDVRNTWSERYNATKRNY